MNFKKNKENNLDSRKNKERKLDSKKNTESKLDSKKKESNSDSKKKEGNSHYKKKEGNSDSKKKEGKLDFKNKNYQSQKKSNFKNSANGNKPSQIQKKETKKPATDTGKTSITGDWFYMNSKELSLRSLYDVLKEQSKDIELWETAGVMEINLSPKTTLDFEEMKPYFRDEEGAAFLTKHQVQSMYMVSFSSEDYEKVLPFFETIITECDGFFCADTANFYPRFPKL